MAFPLDFFENFEAGTKGDFDSESDDGNRLDFPHAHDLAPVMPYRGAYCCRVNLGKNSSDAYLEEGVTWSNAGTLKYGRFRLFIGKDVQFGNNADTVTILQFYSSTSTKESRLVLGRIDPIGIVLASIEEGSGEDFTNEPAYFKAPIGEWFTVEFDKWAEATGGDLGVWLSGVCHVQCKGQAEGSTTKFRLGAMDQSATANIQGTLYFDDFAIDDARLYDDESAHNGALSDGSMLLTKSGFAFLGAGTINQVALVDGGSGDCRVKVYDTDKPNQLPLGSLRESLATTTASTTARTMIHSFSVKQGAYVELSGTNPQAIVKLGTIASDTHQEGVN